MRQTTRRSVSDWIYLFSVVAFMMFALRDGLTGSLRWALNLVKLDVLWFLPDLLAFGSFFIFIFYQIVACRNMVATLFTVSFLFSLAVSVFFFNDSLFSFFATIKGFLPIFVGFCFFRRSITELPVVRMLLTALLMASVVGLILSPYIQYPWLGHTISAFGIERQASRLWWTGGEIRYGGLAGDSTMAAFITIFSYFLLSRHWGFLANVLSWGPIIWAVQTSTSKTALGTIVLYMMIYLFQYFLRNSGKLLPTTRFIAQASFICLIIPPVLMIVLSGVDLASIDYRLASMQDRITNTWQLPFVHLAELFPAGLFIGCGVGCFFYPMTYTKMAAYHVPLDNFYLTTFIDMGYPFLLFVVLQFMAVRKATDMTKLTLISIFNFYSLTIQCYGPSFATLMYGYIFSEIFIDRRGRQVVGQLSVPFVSLLRPPPPRLQPA